MSIHHKSCKSSFKNKHSKDDILDRVAQFLALGEAVTKLHQQSSPDPFSRQRIEESDEGPRQRVDSLTEEVLNLIFTDEIMLPVTICLGGDRNLGISERLCVLALVAYSEFTAIYEDVTLDSIAKKASILFSEEKSRGMLQARQILGALIERGTLLLNGKKVFVTAELRRWMSGYNIYAEHGLLEQDLLSKSYGKEPQKTVSRIEKSKESNQKSIEARVGSIPILTPKEIFDEIGRYGYIGQDAARRTVSLAAYRHVNRLRMMHLDGFDMDKLPTRSNILLMGETGTGKTFLIRTLFEKILQLPTAICDATTITEAGYVGDDVSIVLNKLLDAADGMTEWGQCGISAIDEFDKIAGRGTNHAAFDGAGTRNDVSRGGVQRGLLKIMEEDAVVNVNSGQGRPRMRSSKDDFRTGNVLFIASGAFTDIEDFNKNRGQLGFAGKANQVPRPNLVAQLCRYGIERELLGRFGAIAHLDRLGVDDLSEIMERNTIERFSLELGMKDIELKIEPEVKKLIVAKAIDRGTGARGLASELSSYLDYGCFQAYSATNSVKRLRIFCEDDDVEVELEYNKQKQQAS